VSPLAEFVLADAPARGDRVALVDGVTGQSYSYAMLDHLVRRCAAGLAERGIAQGDVVGIFAPNCPDYAIAFHGVARAGAVATTVNSLYTADEVAFQLRDAGARLLITVPAFLDRAMPAAGAAGIDDVVVFGEAAGATSFADLLATGAAVPEPVLDPSYDLVTLPYSSGTTGLPKGVMLTHRNLVANIVQFAAMRHIDESDVVLAILPFFHIYGQTVVLNDALCRGAEVVTMPRFDLELFLSLIEKHRVTALYVAPPIVVALGKSPLVDHHDLSSVRFIISGAAPLDAELQRSVAERLGCEVGQGYGLTETSPVTHTSTDGVPTVFGSIGQLIPNTEARLVDPASGADGDTGELWIRGPQVMTGYLGNAPATAETIDGDGWLHTGDIATVDADGWFTVVDRLKELIKYKGYQVAPAELEGLLLTNPAIADAAVVGVPDEDAGEIPKAFVVLKPDARLSPAEIMDFVAGHVAPHKRIRDCELIDAIPKSPSGKILRRVLREREASTGG
jgi:acyl-CoA synthetase (AMP-forming)/AMP-acid ligase II